jgi:long-chain fatty acid transport protein
MQALYDRLVGIRTVTVTVASLSVLTSSAWANGINRNGTDAASMAMGGTDVAWARSPLQAMGDNPAGLGFLNQNEFDLGGVAALAQGKFSSASGSSGDLSDSPGEMGEGAIGIPLGNSPITIGISCIPDSMLLANWSYMDPAGGLGGVSYGNQTDKSEILVLRTAAGIGLKLSSQLSVGLSIGGIYNKNELITPYIFQNLQPPGPNGAKTLLDLHTSGFGWNAQIGILYRPLTNLQFGLSYQNKYTVASYGDATGDAYAQFPPTPPGVLAFHYQAEVDNTFPDQVSLGGSWQFLPDWRVAAQVDWIDWANAFNTLPVKLSNGSNPAVNGVVGSTFSDYIPLNWKSEFVYRVGLEYDPTENLALRAGYCYGHSPVPSATLTPMTAAILENTVALGVGYRWKACAIDVAYQCDLPQKENVGTSSLLSGEYSNSSTDVYVHWVAVTLGVNF